MEIQTIVMELEAKEYQGFLANTWNWERGTEQILPLDFQKNQPCWHLNFIDIRPPEL